MDDENVYKKLPTEEKCVHKLWKARLVGYEEAIKLFNQIDNEKSPEWNKYLGLIKKFVTDSNAVAQEKGLEATLVFVENCGHAGKTVGEVMSGIVSKCIAASKTKTKELALQITLMYIEIEKHEIVQEELMKGMEQKNPKVVSACISAMISALKQFGNKVVTIKPMVKKIPILLADRDKGVRDEMKALVVEMHRWIGPAIEPHIASLQPVVQQELRSAFTHVEPPHPTRYLRSQQPREGLNRDAAAEGGAEEDEVDDAGGDASVDPYDLLDPENILSKIPKDFYDKLEKTKWQERKEALDSLEAILKNAPKLEPGDYGDLVRALKKIITNDKNVIVVAQAIRQLGLLAGGLRGRFQPYAAVCVQALLEKFKEKKANVVTALREAIDLIYPATNLEIIMEDMLAAFENKNPSVKSETALFLARSLCVTQPAAFNKKLLKAYIPALMKLLESADPAVRDAAAEALGTASKLVGEKNIAPHIGQLDNLKQQKINEAAEKAVIKVKTTASKPAKSAPAPAKTAAKPAQEQKQTKPAKKTAGLRKPGAATAASHKKPIKASPPREQELTPEDVEEQAEELIGATFKDLGDSNWKTRLTAAQTFHKTVQGLSDGEVSAQLLLRIVNRKPGLRDTNVQVLRARFDTVKCIMDKFTVTVTALDSVLQEIVCKLGEASFQPICSDCLLLAAGACGLDHVCGNALSYAMDTQKNPKVQAELFNWIGHAVQTIGYGELNVDTYLSAVRRAISATNPSVRSSAIALVGALSPYAGPALTAAFANEKPAVRQAIQQEQAKHDAYQVSKSASQGSLMDASDDDYKDAAEDDRGTTVPETAAVTDLAPLITEDLLAEINDKNWKVRNEGLEKLKNIISSAGPIKSSLGELPHTLEGRLLDSNSKIVQTTLQICESLAEAMGPRCKQHIRTLFPRFFITFGDNKQWIRAAGLKTVESWVCAAGGAQHVLEGELVLDALKGGTPLSRATLLTWLAENLPNVPAKSFNKDELAGCLGVLYAALEDRSADVRRAANDCVLPFMLHLSYELMHKQLDKLKPASKTTILAALDKARPNLPVQPLPSTKKKDDSKTVKSAGALKKDNEKKTVKGKAVARPATAGTKKKEDDDTMPLLPNNNAKNQRIVDDQKLKVLKWNFVTPREEFFELLKEQMTSAGVNKQLIGNMFHADFRYHLKAIESLTDDLPENVSALMCNLDLVLKWHTLRFFDTNPSVILKGMEYLSLVFQYLIDNDYTMAEYEANCFIPYLVQKVGDPKDTVRNAVKALFKQICVVYSVTKLFGYLMEGLKSKNARQRAECLECICHLVEQYGAVVAGSGALKEVARHIGDRDNAVRSAALNAVAAVYFLEGERVFKNIGQISDKDMSLLEERIKRAAKTRSAEVRRSMVVPLSATGRPVSQTPIEPEPEPEPQLITVEAALPEEEEDTPAPAPALAPPTPRAPDSPTSIIRRVAGPLGISEDVVEVLCAKLPPMPAPARCEDIDISFLDEPIPVLTRPECYVRYLAEKANVQNPAPAAPTSNYDDSLIVNTIHSIGSPDMDAALCALGVVQSSLRSDRRVKLVSYAGRIATALAAQLARFDHIGHPHFPSFLFTLINLFECGSLSSRVDTPSLMAVVRVLLRHMAAPADPSLSANMRALNVACARLIDNADHTNVWCALITLLHESLNEQEPTHPQYQEFLLKCIWKVLRSTSNWELDALNYDAVLHKVHLFYSAFPQSYWKNKPPKGDTPYRTIKTLVHTLVKKKGVSLVHHLSLIQNPKETELYAYILRIFRSLNLDVESIKENTPNTGNNNPGSSCENGALTANRLPRHVHDQLASILNQIGHKNDHEALVQLYELRERHPGVDIWTFMQDSSYHYRNYVERCLKDIGETRNKIKLHPRTVQNWNTSEDNMENVSEKDAYYYVEKLRSLQKRAGMKQTTSILRMSRPERSDVINDNLLPSRPHSIDPQLELNTSHTLDTQAAMSQRNEADLDAIRMKLQQIKESSNFSRR